MGTLVEVLVGPTRTYCTLCTMMLQILSGFSVNRRLRRISSAVIEKHLDREASAVLSLIVESDFSLEEEQMLTRFAPPDKKALARI